MKKNTLLSLLAENGYTNTNTNRERAVRNINMLLDSGVLQLKFVSADKYNAKDANWAFWYDAKDGKRRCTNYKVTLYGKTYYGSFTPKRENVTFGWGMGSAIQDIDNSKVDIDSLQLRIARLLSIVKKNGDFMKSEVFAKYGECSCGKCNGLGVIPAFMHYANGICFDCGGSGVDNAILKMHIQESFNSVKTN